MTTFYLKHIKLAGGEEEEGGGGGEKVSNVIQLTFPQKLDRQP